jgi:hypothetical protein
MKSGAALVQVTASYLCDSPSVRTPAGEFAQLQPNTAARIAAIKAMVNNQENVSRKRPILRLILLGHHLIDVAIAIHTRISGRGRSTIG